MKKLISVITIIFILILSVIPSYAAEATAECEHTLAFNSEDKTAICPDCGKEVYECERCEYVFCVENRECPICKAKRSAITNEEKAEDFINRAKTSFYLEAGTIAFLFILFVLLIILAIKKKEEERSLYFAYAIISLIIIVILLIFAVKTHQIIAPFM